MKHATKRLLTAVTISVVLAMPCARAGVLPKTAEILPPETILVADIDDFSQLRGRFEKTDIYKLYKDPAMEACVKDFKTKWREKVRQTDDKILKAIVEAGVFPEGRLALALVLDEQAAKADEPTFLFITQWGKNTPKIKEAIDKMVVKAIEDGTHRKTEDYRGVTIVTLIKELPPVKVPDLRTDKSDRNEVPTKTLQRPPVKTHHCFIDDCLIGSTNVDTLKFVLGRRSRLHRHPRSHGAFS